MTHLRPATLLFLFVPYLVFLAGWVQVPWAIAIGALCLWGLRRALLPDRAAAGEPLAARDLARAVLPAVLVFAITGVGGWGYQDADWLRGNAVFLSLVEDPWPVVYETASEPLLLVYYIAFYLPAAAVGKWLGWQAANLTLFLYGLAGISLAALWVVRLAGVRRWWVVPLFLAFSGMDAVGTGLRSLFEALSGDPEPRPWRYLEWWVGYGVACLPSHLNLLVFAPKQALPGWLLTALVVQDARERRLPGSAVLYGGLSTLWAPFVTLGLVPFVGVLVGRELWRDRRPAALLTGANLAGLALGLVAAAYFATRFHPYVSPIDTSGLYQEVLTLSLFRRGPAFLVLYPLFVALEFGLLHALLYGVWWRERSLMDEPLRVLFVTSTVVLCVLPWINLGWNNDLVMRACIPMLFVTALVTIRALGRVPPQPDALRRRLTRGIVAVLVIGAVNTAVIAGRHVQGIVAQGSLVSVPEPAKVLDLFELQEQRYMEIGFNFVGQYLGSPESPVARHFLAAPPGADR
ncbi:MAG: hypothetical protein ACQGVC_03110 [Myxococcota bacterium]